MGDAFVVISPSLEEFFGGLLGRERLTLLPNAIQIPPQGGKEYGRHRILFLGRICREKGIRELLSVMPALKEKYPDANVTVADFKNGKQEDNYMFGCSGGNNPSPT